VIYLLTLGLNHATKSYTNTLPFIEKERKKKRQLNEKNIDYDKILDNSNIDFYNSYAYTSEINIEKKQKRKRRENVEIV
tara:strand:- start:364 stop:600 length:237 start_codon:yes stop_codon:yes gene_type:complete